LINTYIRLLQANVRSASTSDASDYPQGQAVLTYT